MNRKEYEKIVEFESVLTNQVIKSGMAALEANLVINYGLNDILAKGIAKETADTIKTQLKALHEMIEPDLDIITEECAGW